MPGAEVLGGEVLAHGLAQVGVDIVRADRLHLALVIDILEQVLPRQVLHPPHHPRERGVGQADLALLTALGAEPQAQGAPGHLGVALAQGRGAETAVVPGVTLVADPDRPEIEQAIDQIIMDRFIDGQLSETPLTLSDLNTIRESFVNSLLGASHQRVRYMEVRSGDESAS